MKGNNSIDEDNLWTPQLEKLFINIMLEEINKGNMADGQFSSDTQKKMLATLNELGKRSFTMTQFKEKFNMMHLLHCEVLHCASTQDPPNSDEENALEEQFIHGGVHVNLESPTQDPVMAILESDITTRMSKRPSDKLISSQMNDALQSMVEASKAKIKASKTKAERYKRYTIDEVSSSKYINILETMEEVNDEIFIKAVEKFKQDPDDREIFVNMSFVKRMVWLGGLEGIMSKQ
ncbi:hypothetical protein RGQ29_020493 [Quercus rubra]|uniref:Myb/SANT-like domain-containing protein n=1 Tax=Quercus rubra TaxID=3512 RepID=A0AAN7FBH7_QUERU|nr:hypothetical protein RGQ29_020493 [Quercus rubra]